MENDHKIKRWLFIGIVVSMMVAWYTWLERYVTFESIKEHREILYSFVKGNYFGSVLVYIAAVISTAFLVPASVPLIVVGGFLFGIFWAIVYVGVGFLVGSALAFLVARYLIGSWLQHRYGGKLESFNDEIMRHGRNYLIILRMIPLFPFFTVNYLAGLTKMPLKRFLWSTVLGMLPCSVIYAFAGRELGKIQSPHDLLTPKFIIIVALLVLFALMPVIHHHMDRLIFKRQGEGSS